MSPRGRVACPLGALVSFQRFNPAILLRYEVVIPFEESENPLKVSLLVSGLCADDRNFLRV
jgi:hypothetical protein